MKVLKFSVAAAALAATALFGCSADQSAQPGGVSGGNNGSMSFNLLASSNVTIASIAYDVNTQGGADVTDGSISVPDDQSQHVPVLGVQSLSSGDYTLKLSATGQLPDGTSVPCTSPTTGFHVNSGANTFVGDITMTCTITSQVDTSGSLTADVSVTTITSTQGSVIETFAYGPRSVQGKVVGGACTYAPISLKVQSVNPVVYSWAATPDGTFTMNASNTLGTYNCASSGSKTLTLTGVLGGVTSTKSVTVTCAPCGVCGNGTVEPGEACDEATPRCTNCQVTPVCGDNTIDAPETCEPPNSATCSATCGSLSCGDGVVSGTEQCDNGAANSNTTPDACRANCTNPTCGDGVIDTAHGETCEPPNSATCRATCGPVMVQTKFDLCHTCITGSSDAAAQATYCDSDAACTAVEKCVVNAVCFNPLPAFCYCGTTDVDLCQTDAFVPTGPCHAEYRAGQPTAVTNADVIQQQFDFGTSTGKAMDILSDVAANVPSCQTACF